MSCYSRFFEFYSGEDKTLSLQVNVNNSATGCKEPLDLSSASEIEVELVASPDNIILKLSLLQVVVDSGPLGKIHVNLTAAQTAMMESGAIVVRVVIAGKTTVAVASPGVKKLEISNC